MRGLTFTIATLVVVAVTPAGARAECAPWPRPPWLVPDRADAGEPVRVPPDPVLYLTSHEGPVDVRVRWRDQPVGFERALLEESAHHRLEALHIHARAGAFRVELGPGTREHWYIVDPVWTAPPAPALRRIGPYGVTGGCPSHAGFPVDLTHYLDAMLRVRWTDGVTHYLPAAATTVYVGDHSCAPAMLPASHRYRNDFELAVAYPDGSVVDLRWAWPLAVAPDLHPPAMASRPCWIPYAVALLAVGLLGAIVVPRRRARARTILP